MDTSIGGSHRSFPTTIWSDILAAADPAAPDYRDRLDALVRGYWKPVYAYVRAAWKKSVEDAKDLTQSFFTHLLEKDTMARVRPDRGSFRGYLKKALKHFLIDADRAKSAREPDRPVFSLEAAPAELERLGPAAPDEPPDRAYDREWFRCLFDAAIADLHAFLKAEGKPLYFDIFRMYCIDPTMPRDTARSSTFLQGAETGRIGPTYRDIALALGVNESDVRNHLNYCRSTFRSLLRRRIREYVAGDEDVDPELEAVLRG